MPTMCGIKRRKPDEALRANFRPQIAIGIASCHLNRDTFQARFFTLAVVVNLCAELMSFGPTQVHTQQHLRPVLRVNAAAASMNTENSITFVVFATQHQRELQL